MLPGLPAGTNVGVCELGTEGVRMTRVDLGGFSAARHLVCALNDALGIDAAAEHAMLVGCLQGWNSEAAAPDFRRDSVWPYMNVERQTLATGVQH